MSVPCLQRDGDIWALAGRAETPDEVAIKPDLLRDLCPDALWRAMWLDQTGVPLNLGRTRRLASPAQRTALAVRDGGCVFPGCVRPIAWCDAHHVDEWDLAAGDTDLPVLALICRHYHGVTHRTGWTMTAQPDQTFTWTTPAGATLYSQRHHGQRTAEPLGPQPPDAESVLYHCVALYTWLRTPRWIPSWWTGRSRSVVSLPRKLLSRWRSEFVARRDQGSHRAVLELGLGSDSDRRKFPENA